MPQTLREIARQIAEDGDHNGGMLGRELVELLDGESVADHLLVGYDVGRALAAAISPKLKPGPIDATRFLRPFCPWTLICTLTVPRATTKKSFASAPSRIMTSPFSKTRA